MVTEDEKRIAQAEIHRTLNICNFCSRTIGISFIDNPPKTLFGKFSMALRFLLAIFFLGGLVIGELTYIFSVLINTRSVVQFVACFHLFGYAVMSIGKMITIWYKRNEIRQVVNELAEIWPVSINDPETVEIKLGSLSALRLSQICYTFFNAGGVCFYNFSPLVVYLYHKNQGIPESLGYVFFLSYPYDKTKPIYHEISYFFEACGGSIAVFSMLASDLLFTTMASHFSMLLRILQVNIRRLANTDNDSVNWNSRKVQYQDCYKETVSVIKIHQRLINYCNNFEEAFSFVNLISVLLSSVDICCVVFTITLLEPWMEISNKLFVGAALTQVGILCWFADDIFRASLGVADAVYESGWYKSNIRCRRILLLLIQRSQKPLYFTAMKFRSITLTTYSSILTTSYSYFTLLYTMYRGDQNTALKTSHE